MDKSGEISSKLSFTGSQRIDRYYVVVITRETFTTSERHTPSSSSRSSMQQALQSRVRSVSSTNLANSRHDEHKSVSENPKSPQSWAMVRSGAIAHRITRQNPSRAPGFCLMNSDSAEGNPVMLPDTNLSPSSQTSRAYTIMGEVAFMGPQELVKEIEGSVKDLNNFVFRSYIELGGFIGW